jgi:hypothetical protein
MAKGSNLGKGIQAIKQTAAAKTRKVKAESNGKGNGMNGPHRPKLLGANVELEVHRAFKQISIDDGTSIQRLVCEALNDFLAKRSSKVRTAIE